VKSELQKIKSLPDTGKTDGRCDNSIRFSMRQIGRGSFIGSCRQEGEDYQRRDLNPPIVEKYKASPSTQVSSSGPGSESERSDCVGLTSLKNPKFGICKKGKWILDPVARAWEREGLARASEGIKGMCLRLIVSRQTPVEDSTGFVYITKPFNYWG